MGKKLLRWRRFRLQGPDRQLMPLGLALGVTFALALTFTGLGIWLGLTLLGFQHFKREPVLDSSTFYSLLKLVFGIVAGIGGVIALVVSYRKQRIAESSEERERARASDDRMRVFNERFITASQQLGADQPAICLAGVYAMTGLADDWEEGRQTCIDVLCAYLRMPYRYDVPEDSSDMEHGSPEGVRLSGLEEVRKAVTKVVVAHLRPDARTPWQGYNFDFTRAIFDHGDFSGVRFEAGKFYFDSVIFAGFADFKDTIFDGAEVNFRGAQMGSANFQNARFNSGTVNFFKVQIDKVFSFELAQFAGGVVSFAMARVAGAVLERGLDGKPTARAISGMNFAKALFAGGIFNFRSVKFDIGSIYFADAIFAGGQMWFDRAAFTGADVTFPRASFRGTDIDLTAASFDGGRVDFSEAQGWTVPPRLSGQSPLVILPAAASQAA